MAMTVSDLAVKILAEKDRGIKKMDFKKNCLIALTTDDYCLEDFEWWFDGIYPDAHKIMAEDKTILVYEIEDTHPLPIDKIKRYAELWFDLDSCDWSFVVIVMDRYGQNPREIDACGSYYAFLKENPHAFVPRNETINKL